MQTEAKNKHVYSLKMYVSGVTKKYKVGIEVKSKAKSLGHFKVDPILKIIATSDSAV